MDLGGVIMPAKKRWHEWAVEFIKETGNCVGDCPSFGTPDDVMTKDEFLIGVSGRTHKYDDCHFVDHVLGMHYTVKDMEEIRIDNGTLNNKVEGLSDEIKEVSTSKKLSKFKENLHIYIDRIYFKKNGSLSVPEPLLDIKKHIENSF